MKDLGLGPGFPCACQLHATESKPCTKVRSLLYAIGGFARHWQIGKVSLVLRYAVAYAIGGLTMYLKWAPALTYGIPFIATGSPPTHAPLVIDSTVLTLRSLLYAIGGRCPVYVNALVGSVAREREKFATLMVRHHRQPLASILNDALRPCIPYVCLR